MHVRERWNDFFFTPASPLPLACLRIGVSIVLLIQFFTLMPYANDLFSEHSLVQQSIGDVFLPMTHVDVVKVGHWLGMTDARTMDLVGAGLLLGILGLGFGCLTRLSALVAWFFQYVLMNSSGFSGYGVDTFIHLVLFYLIFAPSGDLLSIDAWLGKPKEDGRWARVFIRILQIHLCITYFVAGLLKAMGTQWWSGEAIWRALMLPEFQVVDFSWLSQWPALALAASLGTLFVEMGYPIFIWSKRTRKAWIAFTLGMHLFIGIFMGMWLFSLMMSVLTLSLFAVPASPSFVLRRFPYGTAKAQETPGFG